MPFSLADLLYGGLLPAVLAAALWSPAPRLLSGEAGRRLATAVALVAGVHAGYWLLGLGRPVPSSHWEWLPWALLLSLAGAAPRPVGGRGRLVSCALVLSVAVAAGWGLVPDWQHLEPSRAAHLFALSAGIAVIALGLQPLARRIAAAELLLVLAAVLVCESAILALAGSLRFAQIAGCGAAALAGMFLVALFDRTGRTAEGMALPFALLAAGMMHIGRVNSFSDVTLISYLLPLAAPMTPWLLIAGPLAGSTGVRRWLLLMPVLLSLLAVGLAAIA